MPVAVGQPLPTAARPPSAAGGEAARCGGPPEPAAGPSPASQLDAVLRAALSAGEADLVRRRLVDGLAELLAAKRVVLGWRTEGAKWQGQGTGQDNIDLRSELGRALAAAFAETTLGSQPRIWTTSQPVPISYRQLAALVGASAVVGLPLAVEGEAPPAALLIFDGDPKRELLFRAIAADFPAVLAGIALLAARATPSRARSIVRGLKRSLAGHKKLAALAVLSVFAAAACFPVADRITCTATLEPSLRRFVGAPFDGKLEKALVKVGDAVTEGQTVALLDRRPLEIELSVHTAQLEEAATRRDAARAKGQASQAQLADLEVAQIERKVEQLEHQLSQLSVTSPIAGIVVRGELERVEGAPLSRGQNLFEIAPLSPLIAELAVPEDEVRLVQRNAAVTIRPLALPGVSLAGRIDQIHPRAEVRESQSVFVSEVALANDDGRLRPGMQARAIVSGPRQPLAWTLLRRPLTRLYRALWW